MSSIRLQDIFRKHMTCELSIVNGRNAVQAVHAAASRPLTGQSRSRLPCMRRW